MWRAKVQRFLARVIRYLHKPPDQSSTIKVLSEALRDLAGRVDTAKTLYMERVCELVEARQMAGAGPWGASPATLAHTDRLITEAYERYGKGDGLSTKLRESANAITAQGVYGDIELALQNVEWRREVNLSWLEFSRWGIQQIILISRLHFIKNPIIRRLVNVCAAYVFARGVDVSTDDGGANEVIRDFFERNKATMGQHGLTELERRKDYDGNLFFVLFTDTQETGKVTCRTIDATEIQEVVTDPDDTDTPWYYRRIWTQRTLDPTTGQYNNTSGKRWYPALGYDPDDKPKFIGDVEVAWDSPILHRKAGAIAKWHFGCPRIYPALDWAREARRYLESCASVAQALSEIALLWTTKGGQQALEGIKQQVGTTVGPTSALWDNNPPAVAGASFASGPGTKVEAFKTQGAGMNPEGVRQYKLMCCMVADVPETFLGDVSTGNLATAMSLDRPTETSFLEKQEAWREDLVTLVSYVLKVSYRAPSGKLRESYKAKTAPVIREAARYLDSQGRWHYVEKKEKVEGTIEVRAEFPAIREGDIPALVKAVVEAMTLENKAGQVIGIDEKEGVRYLYALLGIERGDEVVEQQYPEKEYERDRTKEILPPPIPKPKALPGGMPAADVQEALRRLGAAIKAWESQNGHSAHTH